LTISTTSTCTRPLQWLPTTPAPTDTPTPTTPAPTDTPTPTTPAPTDTSTPTETIRPTDYPTTTPTPGTPPLITFILPAQGPNELPNDVNVYGENFQPGATVSIDAGSRSLLSSLLRFFGLDTPTPLTTVFISSTHLRAVVPASQTPGVYDVIVANPDNNQAVLPDAYIVLAPEADDLFGYGYELWTSPAPLRAGNSAQLGLIVHRQGGEATLFGVTVDFYLGDPTAGGLLLGNGNAPFLAPDSAETTTGVAWTPDAVGNYDLYAVIDPTNAVPEAIETNNMIHQTVSVLPPRADLTPPTVDGFTIDGGAAETFDRYVILSVSASDPADPPPSTGAQSVFILEYEYNDGAALWVPAQLSGWLPYPATPSSYPWTILPVAGVKYLEVWVADGAGNISLAPLGAFINYLKSDSLVTGDSRYYVYWLNVGQSMTVTITPASGDPDLYVWPNSGAPWYSLNGEGLVDEVSFTAPESDYYIVQVYGYTAAEYTLTTGAGRETNARPQPLLDKVPLSHPGLSAEQLPEGLLYTLPVTPVTQIEIYLPIVIR
jgi:hypothetical protein